MKKVVSMVLVAILVLSGIPTMSFAETGDTFQYKGNGYQGSSLDFTDGSGREAITMMFDVVKNPGNVIYNAYCVDKSTEIKKNAFYNAKFLEDISYIGSNAPKVRTIITNGFSNVNLETLEAKVNTFKNSTYFFNSYWTYKTNWLGFTVKDKYYEGNKLSTEDAIAATQAAVWHYSNGSTPRWENNAENVRAVYDYLMSLPGTPKPTAANITVSAPTKEIKDGNVVISFKYSNAGTNPSVEFSLTGFTKSEKTTAGETTVTYTKALNSMVAADFQDFTFKVKGTKQVTDVFAFDPVNGTNTSQTLVSLGYTFNVPVENQVNGTIKGLADRVTVTFEAKGGSAVPAQTIDYASAINPLPTTTLTGHAFGGWYTDANNMTNATKFTTSTIVRNSMTVFAKWTPNEYTVTYNPDGGNMTEPKTVKVKYNQSVTSTPTPTKEGYDFKGWFLADGTTEFTVATKVLDNMTVKAKWQLKEYTVTYHGNGTESDPAAVKVQHGKTVGSLPVVSIEGKTFLKWTTADGTEFKANTVVTSNLDVTAQWKTNLYKVNYDSNGGSYVDQAEVPYNAYIRPLPVPTKEGYEFKGWFFENGTEFTQDTAIKTTINVTAKWEAKDYTVTFDANKGTFKTGSSTPQTVKYNTAVSAQEVEKEGYTFDGWYLGNDKYDFSTPVTQNITLVAHWTAKPVTVTFDANGGNPVPSFDSVVDAKIGTLPLTEKEGYEFAGWYLPEGVAPINSEYVLKDSITLKAHWTQIKYNVTFDAAGGSPVESKEVAHGNVIDPVPGSSKEHYQLEGWYAMDGTKLTSDLQIKQDYAFTAFWTPKAYTVTFNPNGGSLNGAASDVEVEYNQPVGSIPTPERDKYNFIGWFTEDELVELTGDYLVTGDVTFYAKWEAKPIEKITLTFNSNGGTAVDSVEIEKGTALGYIPQTSKDGFTFEYWYDENGDQLTVERIFESNTTFNAQWKEIPAAKVTVTFDANGGSAVEPVTVDKGTALGTLPTTSKDGFDFLGWFVGETPFTAETVVSENVTVVAQWKEKATEKPTEDPVVQVTVTFDANGGSTVAPATINQGTSLGELPSTTKEGFTFLGWFLGETPFTASTVVTENITVVAQWKAIETEAPTENPTEAPTEAPTTAPTEAPTVAPTEAPVVPVGPTPVEATKGTVEVSYQDTQGKVLSSSSFTGDVGSTYSTIELAFEGYTLVETPSNANGTISEGTTTVVYVYTNGVVVEEEATPLGDATAPFDIDKYGSSTPEVIIEEVEEEETPLADALPKTGQIPAELFYGIGGLITAAGVFLKKKND